MRVYFKYVEKFEIDCHVHVNNMQIFGFLVLVGRRYSGQRLIGLARGTRFKLNTAEKNIWILSNKITISIDHVFFSVITVVATYGW